MFGLMRCAASSEAMGYLHSASTKSFSLTNSGKVSFVRTSTSEAAATAARAAPSARVPKVRILTVKNGIL